MNDMRLVIVPKSDQINADDLLGGPRTITIQRVAIRPGTEQPVSIYFEGDEGKPYKPCKSMARVMVHCWGPDANEYVGRSMTLYRDPQVLWGGMAVGGIRISHMSHISRTQVLALTETKGKRKPFTINPLVLEKPPAQKAAVTIGGWITDTFASRLAACGSIADVEKATASKQYLAAKERATEEERAEMQRLVDAAIARISPAAFDDGTADDDDGWPGPRPGETQQDAA